MEHIGVGIKHNGDIVGVYDYDSVTNMGLVYSSSSTDNFRQWMHFCNFKPNNNSQWIHYENENSTECGYPLNGSMFNRRLTTKVKNDVTCQRCIDKMKLEYWYCSHCNTFLDDNEVTHDENCVLCNNKIIL